MPRPSKDAGKAVVHPITPAAIMEAFDNLVSTVPDAPEGDISDILGPILAATDWTDMDTDDALPSSKTLAGRELWVERISKKWGDKQDDGGWYLMCDGTDVKTGQVLRFTAGGKQAVAVLSKLHVLGNLPAKIRFDAVDVRSGNKAINCKILDATGASRVING